MEWSWVSCPQHEFITSPPPTPGLLGIALGVLGGHFQVDQQHTTPTLHTTLWHIIPKRAHQNSGLSSSLLPLGDQSIGARRVGLTCTPGMPAPPPPCTNRSNKSLTFVNPLGKFLSSVHDKSHEEKPGKVLREGLPLTTPSAVSSAVMPHESHTEHDCFSSLGNLTA